MSKFKSSQAKPSRKDRQPIELGEVARSEIKTDPNNPRRMDEYARKRLNRGLDRYGLLLPILVNRRTKMLISGHQRLAWLDGKTKSREYRLKVAWCDLDEKAAREAALLLNNPGAMGEWDIEKLGKIILEGDLDLKSAAFDRVDLELIFGEDEEIAQKFGNILGAAPESVKKNLAEAGETERMGREQRKAGNAAVASDRDTERYVSVVFADRARKNQFLRRVGILSDERYVDGERVMVILEKQGAGKKPAPKGETA